MLGKYNGFNATVGDFFAQYNIVATINKWDSNERAIILPIYLEGPALYFYKKIYNSSLSLEQLVDKFEKEFDRRRDFVADFYALRPKVGQAPIDFLYELEQVAAKAEIHEENKIILHFIKYCDDSIKRILSLQLIKKVQDLKHILYQHDELHSKSVDRAAVQRRADPCNVRGHNYENNREEVDVYNNFSINTLNIPQVNLVYDNREGQEVETRCSPMISSLFCNQEINTLVDTGAMISVASSKLIKELGKEKEMESMPSDVKLCGINGSTLEIKGRIRLFFIIDGVVFKHYFVVINNLRPLCLLGQDFLNDNGAMIDFSNQCVKIGKAWTKFLPKEEKNVNVCDTSSLDVNNHINEASPENNYVFVNHVDDMNERCLFDKADLKEVHDETKRLVIKEVSREEHGIVKEPATYLKRETRDVNCVCRMNLAKSERLNSDVVKGVNIKRAQIGKKCSFNGKPKRQRFIKRKAMYTPKVMTNISSKLVQPFSCSSEMLRRYTGNEFSVKRVKYERDEYMGSANRWTWKDKNNIHFYVHDTVR